MSAMAHPKSWLVGHDTNCLINKRIIYLTFLACKIKTDRSLLKLYVIYNGLFRSFHGFLYSESSSHLLTIGVVQKYTLYSWT